MLKYLQDPVPVELISFNAFVNDHSVELRWTTATEINNKGFEIEKKSENKSQNSEWIRIGFVEGSGTTTEMKTYSFLDEKINSGKYAYRLKQIDFDGTYSYSDVIKVDIDLTPKVYSLYQNYPNPFNPNTKIKYSIPAVITNGAKQSQLVTLEVYDILGREIITLVNEMKSAGEYEIEFDGSNLPSGVYFYKLEAVNVDGNKFVLTKKMILNK